MNGAPMFRPEPWMARGSCRGSRLDPGAWFPDKGEHGGRTDAAKAICGACPVRAACLAYALARHEGHGIWGGLTAEERNRPDQVAMRRARAA